MEKVKVFNNSTCFWHYGLAFDRILVHLSKLHLPMLINLNPILQVFARQKEEKKERQLDRKDWINADRIVMIILFLGVIIGAIVFS